MNFELIALNCEARVSDFFGWSIFIDNIFANYPGEPPDPKTRRRAAGP